MAKISKPNYTQIPDEVLDSWMAQLTGAELKVLLYICRRTFGFRREADAISLAQFSTGIVRSDGRRLDNGTGLSQRAVQDALDRLGPEDQLHPEWRTDRGGRLNLIIPEKTKGPDGRQEVTVYRLNLHEPVAEIATGPVADFSEKPVAEIATTTNSSIGVQQTVESSPPTTQQDEHGAGQARDKGAVAYTLAGGGSPAGTSPDPEQVSDQSAVANLTGALAVVIGRHARRLGIKGRDTISSKMLRQLERDDTGEDYRRALVHGLERFAGGESRDSIGQWAYDWLKEWHREHGNAQQAVRGHPGHGDAPRAAPAPARGGYGGIVAAKDRELDAAIRRQLRVGHGL